MTSERQTLSFLKRRFEQAGIRPIHRYGQNFLIDLNLLGLLANSAQLTDRDVVLEVGTGTGALTNLLAQRAAWVVTVELDPQLHQLAREALVDRPNVTMLRQDALKNKNTIQPELLAAIRSKLDESPDRRFKLVANLPYHIATPLVSNLLADEPLPQSMTVTIQLELAERIVAQPGSKDYGALSIWIQSQCEVQLLRTLPPSVFWPRPKVHSAIVHLVLQPERRASLGDVEFFHQFTRALFLHRRKHLRGSLASALDDPWDKPAIDRLLARLGLEGQARAERLPVDAVRRLAQAVRHPPAPEPPGS